jgi:hypothetical protein
MAEIEDMAPQAFIKLVGMGGSTEDEIARWLRANPIGGQTRVDVLKAIAGAKGKDIGTHSGPPYESAWA